MTTIKRYDGHHVIEESVAVYLKFDFERGAWVLDLDEEDMRGSLPSVYPDYLDVDGPLNEVCDCTDKDACEKARKEAGEVDLPTGDQLAHLLLDLAADLAPRAGSGTVSPS